MSGKITKTLEYQEKKCGKSYFYALRTKKSVKYLIFRAQMAYEKSKRGE
jgi:hypothetical protein